MGAKYNCGECGTRHRPGECPMLGQRRGEGKGPRPWRRIAKETPQEPLCFPHKWAWTPWTAINRIFHTRHQICAKCHTPRPGSRDTEKHHMKHNVCSRCGFAWIEGF